MDEHTVAHTSGLKQEFFSATRHPSNPILKKTEPWEGVGPYVWGNRLMQDHKTGEFRLWYIAYAFEGNFYRWGLATSSDGFHWTKPDLRLEKFGNDFARNCLPLGPHPEKGTRSIARDPRPETPESRRYLGIRFTYNGELASFSPDGLSWTESPANPVWHVPSDMIHVMWDEWRNAFTAYYKVWEVRGTEIRTDKSESPFLAYMPAFDQKKLENGTTQFEGPRITFVTNGAARVEAAKFILRSRKQAADDGGGSSLSGDWTGKRVQAWATSKDGIHWNDERVILGADEKDPPTANIQFAFVMPYGGYYLGFLTLHDARGLFQIQFAWSQDGIHWRRTWREPWLDIGPKGAFDSGMVLGPADPIFYQDKMAFPYGGFPITHDSPRQDWESAIGLAMMRLDGFSAWRAEQNGELITQKFVCTGDELFINADARDGAIKVEVLDEKGRPFKSFEAKSCSPIKGDTLEQEDAGWVKWKNAPSLERLQGKQIQLRFELKHTSIYSFRLADKKTMHLPVPRATDH